MALSLLLHLLPFVPDFDFGQKSRSTAALPLQAELRPPPAAAPVPLSLPEPPPPADAPKPPPRRKTPPEAGKAGPAHWTQSVRRHLQQLDSAGQFYPAEAIARGQEGEVVVLLVLDESGRVSGARIEQGSGHAILDDAALRAVRSLHSLPADTPRQTLLPIRFRLNGR